MVKKLILTYYYVWFQGHLRSKHANDFSHHWFHAFLQVQLTVTCVLLTILIISNALFDLQVFTMGRGIIIFLVLIIPALLLHHLVFNIYGADKQDDEPAQFGIVITRRSKVTSWLVFIGSPLLAVAAIFVASVLR